MSDEREQGVRRGAKEATTSANEQDTAQGLVDGLRAELENPK